MSENFVAGRWVAEPGKIPWFDHAPDVSSFIDAVYARGLIIDGFDWSAWREEAERIESDAAFVAVAALDTVRRVITLRLREERISEGALAAWVSSGRAARLLTRLAILARNGS